MRIPIFYIPKTRFKKYINIEKRYKSDKYIIPLGCDCHPSYVLQKLNLRKQSYPFDWLNTEPLLGLKFVSENIINNFSHFLIDLEKNDRGYVVSKCYKYAEFMHEPNLINNKEDVLKFERRVKRFILDIENQNISYLFNIHSLTFKSENDINQFIDSVLFFCKSMKFNDTLHIYLRYDEDFEENNLFNNLFKSKLPKLNNLYFCEYIRFKEIHGIWGNPKNYTNLLKKLEINLKFSFPRIYIS